jgi:mono/diheme cytochrome c family protein
VSNHAANPLRTSTLTCWLLLLPLFANAGDPAEQVRSTLISNYEQQVLPVLKTHCFSCHGKDKQKGDVNFSTFSNGNAAIGNPRLWKSSAHMLGTHEMPPGTANA